MFIERLWKENSKLAKETIKKIFNIDTVTGDGIEFYGIKDGAITVGMYKSLYSMVSDEDVIARINDFEVLDNCFGMSREMYTERWMKFMYKVFGDEYIDEYITLRNNKLDKFMREYERKYTNETISILANLGVEKYKDMQNQTK